MDGQSQAAAHALELTGAPDCRGRPSSPLSDAGALRAQFFSFAFAELLGDKGDSTRSPFKLQLPTAASGICEQMDKPLMGWQPVENDASMCT